MPLTFKPTDPAQVYAVGALPPEIQAYGLARYSRSADSYRESLQWIHEQKAKQEKFFETFYFQYGHASIADLAFCGGGIALEGVSELAAIYLEDEPLWNGQAKSSRYQNFERGGYVLPAKLAGTPEEPQFHGAIDRLAQAYRDFQPKVLDALKTETPCPASMNPEAYARTMAARAFDVIRYLLPLACRTNVGQTITIRVLERQIVRLLSSPIQELQDIGQQLLQVCQDKPDNTWGELMGIPSLGPLAPTLARYGKASAYQQTVYERLRATVAEMLNPHTKHLSAVLQLPRPVVQLMPAHDPYDELVTTLLYRGSVYPYRALLRITQECLSRHEKTELVRVASNGRPAHEELPREFRSGYGVILDTIMDLGAWRDFHRHRRCQQIWQDFSPALGFDTPPLLDTIGLGPAYRQVLTATHHDVSVLSETRPTEAQYLLPFATRIRSLWKMDLAELAYIVKTRTQVKGHWSYRKVAWEMREAVLERYPHLADAIPATSPDITDTLTR